MVPGDCESGEMFGKFNIRKPPIIIAEVTVLQLKGFVLVSYCCYNELPHMLQPKITQPYYFTALEVKSPKWLLLG